MVKFLVDKYKGLVTGILFEFEDTFPFKHDLECLKSKYHYSHDDILSMIELCNQNNLNFVPLIQTFGHLEFMLKN